MRRGFLVVMYVLVGCVLWVPPPAVACISDSAMFLGLYQYVLSSRVMCVRGHVCVHLHGTLYPMMDCISTTIVLQTLPGSADAPQGSIQFYYY